MEKLTGYQSLTPAYGRDYKTKMEAIADFVAGKDFIIHTPWQSTYCSIRDFAPGATANIRYKRAQLIAVYKVKGTEGAA